MHLARDPPPLVGHEPLPQLALLEHELSALTRQLLTAPRMLPHQASGQPGPCGQEEDPQDVLRAREVHTLAEVDHEVHQDQPDDAVEPGGVAAEGEAGREDHRQRRDELVLGHAEPGLEHEQEARADRGDDRPPTPPAQERARGDADRHRDGHVHVGHGRFGAAGERQHGRQRDVAARQGRSPLHGATLRPIGGPRSQPEG